MNHNLSRRLPVLMRYCTSRVLGLQKYRTSSISSTTTSSSSSSSSSSFTSDPELAGLFKNPIVQQLWKERCLAKNLQNKNTTLTPESSATASSSRDVRVTYHFSTDVLLREAYRNPWGQMRLGRLMEDLDALAGNIAFFHVHDNSNSIHSGNRTTNETSTNRKHKEMDTETNQAGDERDVSSASSTRPQKQQKQQQQQQQQYPIIVTASVDRITLKHTKPSMHIDQHLLGFVTWTGKSSMEICMQCQSHDEDGPWLEAYVTFVTLDPETKLPTRLPPLVPRSDAERDRFEAGARRAAIKKQKRQRHRRLPTSVNSNNNNNNNCGIATWEELVERLAESLLEEAGPLLTLPSLADPNGILMQQTKMQNALIAQPQVQNMHARIFGGFLVRRAFELAFANAYLFGGALPIFMEVDEVSFKSPVDVGDLLVFNSRVLYTEDPLPASRSESNVNEHLQQYQQEHLPMIHVEVECWVTEPEKAAARMSNQFYFTFASTRSNSSSVADRDHLNHEGTFSNSHQKVDKTSKSRRSGRIRQVLPSNIDEARRMAARILGDQEQHQHHP